MRNTLFLLMIVFSSVACTQTPCRKVANHICTIPGEESACQVLKNVENDASAQQQTCANLESIATVYAKDPSSLMQKALWTAGFSALSVVGVVNRIEKGFAVPTSTADIQRIGKKVEESGMKTAEEALKVVETTEQ